MKMQITNEILSGITVCQYKVYRKFQDQTGIISDYEILYKKLKQFQKSNFEKTNSEDGKSILYKVTFDNKIPDEGVALNQNFKNEKFDITVDGIEFNGKKNIVPIFFTPFEKVTKYDKLNLALQASILQNEFNLHVENCKVILGKSNRQTKFKLNPLIKTIKRTIGDLNKIIFD